jgi:ubiquitin-conjugating enzyme E2 variant
MMPLLLSLFSVAVQVVLIAMLADFVAGLIHWAEDAYFNEDTPIIGPLVIRPNIVHHHFPRYFTKLSWWESSRLLCAIGAVTLGVAWWGGFLSWQLGLFVAISVNANHVHKLAHRTRAENGLVISKLQDWRILQTPHQHGLHHTDPKNTYYCPITNLVNPLLERINFWHHAEALIEKLTGATHRHDTAVRGQGPGPDWLEAYRPAKAKTRAAQPARPTTTGTKTTSHPTACTCAQCQLRGTGKGRCAKHRLRRQAAQRLATTR